MSTVDAERGAELAGAVGQVTVPADANPEQFRLVGNVTGAPPHRGQLAHHGWQATRCDIPKWSGQPEVALVVAPAEVEL